MLYSYSHNKKCMWYGGFYMIIGKPHSLSRESWLLKYKICTVTNHLRNSAGSIFLIEWSDTYHWFIYREALPSQPQFTTPQKFSRASCFCQSSAPPRRPVCRPQWVPRFTDPRLPTGRQCAGGSGHDSLQGSTHPWECADWHWQLTPVHTPGKAGEEGPSLGLGFSNTAPALST